MSENYEWGGCTKTGKIWLKLRPRFGLLPAMSSSQVDRDSVSKSHARDRSRSAERNRTSGQIARSGSREPDLAHDTASVTMQAEVDRLAREETAVLERLLAEKRDIEARLRAGEQQAEDKKMQRVEQQRAAEKSLALLEQADAENARRRLRKEHEAGVQRDAIADLAAQRSKKEEQRAQMLNTDGQRTAVKMSLKKSLF